MYSLFELANGQKFYYDSEDNTIYNEYASQLSLPSLHPLEHYTTEAKNHGVDTKVNNPIAIRILLGHACNYSCTYCMQKDIGNPFERPESFHIDDFIDAINNNLDTSRLHRIELWGGEPLLYWKDMMRIMDLLDAPGREFFISTNGSPFVQKHVDYFKALSGRVLINVSHDAYAQDTLRGEDILKNPSKVGIIKQLIALPNVQLGFGCVVSATNYDLFAINQYFREFAEAESIDKIKITFIPAKNYDERNSENSALHVIRGDMLADFSDILGRFIQASLNDPTHKTILKNNIIYSPEGVIEYALFLKNQTPITTRSGCGADSNDILSVDTRGNVRLCPHTNEKFISGTLNKFKEIKIVSLDLDRKHNHCAPCPVKRLCRSSCPIKFPKEVFYTNCALEKVWWGNIQLAAMKLLFGQDVKMIKTGIEKMAD
jgi:uncharacterized protein